MNTVQTRVFVGKEDSDTSFAQVTVQFISEAIPVELYGNRVRAVKKASAESHPTKRKALGQYETSFDPSGGEYYWHTHVRKTTWKKPSNSVKRMVNIDSDRGSLGTYGITLANNDQDGTVQQEHIVVFERCLSSDDRWKIAFF